MPRLLPAVAVALLGLTAPAADDKPKTDDVPFKGAWEKKTDEHAISFTFTTKTEGKCEVKLGGAGVTLTLKYELKGDKVSAEVTEVKEEGDFPAKVPKGYKMKFTLKKGDGDAVKISDYEAENADEARAVVEGEYKKKGD